MNKIKTIHYNLLNYPSDLHEGGNGLYAIIHINDSYVAVFEHGAVHFSLLDVRCAGHSYMEYGYIDGIPESVKFYHQGNNAFYCFENVKKALETAKTTIP